MFESMEIEESHETDDELPVFLRKIVNQNRKYILHILKKGIFNQK